MSAGAARTAYAAARAIKYGNEPRATRLDRVARDHVDSVSSHRTRSNVR
jgi:hypothetical protein